MKSFKIFLLFFALLFVFGVIFAQAHLSFAQQNLGGQEETPTTEISQEAIEAINLDENIQPEDLEISEPRLLPDNPFYFFKNWQRALQNLFTFGALKKAELKMKFANEKLMEIKMMVEQEKSRTRIEKAIQNYQDELDEVKRFTEKIRVSAEEDEEVGKFLNKFIQHQVLHQRILQKLEEQVPAEAFEKIKAARERHLERFQDVMLKLEEKDKIPERLEKNLEEIKGSKYKNFKNLEVLLELEEKVPQEAKEAIRQAQENALKRLQGDLEKMSPEDQERFKEYLEGISGEKEAQMEILENLKEGLPEMKENLIQIRERILERIRERGCPAIEKPVPGFCEEGRIVIKKDGQGCIAAFECVVPAEIEIPEEPEKPQVCITLWDPVCGKDGKTYSNECFAQLAGVEIDYKGKCKGISCQTDNDCPTLKCGPEGTIMAKCKGLEYKCIDGECKIQSVPGIIR